jgi:signal transduction histidine kinase
VDAEAAEALVDLPWQVQSFRELIAGIDAALPADFRAGSSGIMLCEPAGDVLQMVAGSYGAAKHVTSSFRISVANTHSTAARVFATGDPCFSNSALEDPAALSNYLAAFGIRRFASLRLVVGGRPIGVFTHANKEGDYAVEHLTRLQVLVPPLGRAVETASRLFELKRNLCLERILSDASVAITSAHSLHDTVSAALESLSEVLEADLIALVPASAAPVLWQTGYVAPGMTERLIAEASEHPDRRSHLTGPQQPGDPGSAALHIPLNLAGQRAGTLSILRSRAVPFAADERDALTRLASLLALGWASEEYQQYRARNARADERQRIADRLHDDVLQLLYAAGLSLDEVVEVPRLHPAVAESVTNARTLVDTAKEALRQAIMGLSVRTRAELVPEVESLVGEIERDWGMPVHLEITRSGAELASRLDRAKREVLLRVAREGLVNAAKHAGPCRAMVCLTRNRRGGFTLTVVDDGIGVGAPASGHGLASLRRMVRRQGGTLRVSSGRSGGTRVVAALPA